MTPLIKILMDDRERSSVIFETLTAMEDVAVHVQRLLLGDFCLDGRLLIERKTLDDFALSVTDGRFFKQMTKMAASPLRGVLILEGRSRDLQRVGVRREALQGALVFGSLILGIPVLRSMEPGETGRLMVYAARQLRLTVSGGIRRPGGRPKGKRKRQLYILQGLPGVGPARAERLLDRFGSVRNVFDACLEDLQAVGGIGILTAQRIQWSVHESIDQYGLDSEWVSEI